MELWNHSLSLLRGLRSLKNWVLQKLSMKVLDQKFQSKLQLFWCATWVDWVNLKGILGKTPSVLLRPWHKKRDQFQKRRSFHWFSHNYELEATWISLIGWPHKTSTVLMCGGHNHRYLNADDQWSLHVFTSMLNIQINVILITEFPDIICLLLCWLISESTYSRFSSQIRSLWHLTNNYLLMYYVLKMYDI